MDNVSLLSSLNAVDTAESQILSARAFLESVYGNAPDVCSRATTPMTVGSSFPRVPPSMRKTGPCSQWSILGLTRGSSLFGKPLEEPVPFDLLQAQAPTNERPMNVRRHAKIRFANNLQDPHFVPNSIKRPVPQRPSALPHFPDISDISVDVDDSHEYAVIVSMYEVYNDRIFDLLSNSPKLKDTRRRALLFKPTEASPDRKVVAGLRKIVCGTYDEALMVLETGLMERRVAGTGSNSVSSRSHGFFCLDVKRRPKGGMVSSWKGNSMTIVDLAGKYLHPSQVQICLTVLA